VLLLWVLPSYLTGTPKFPSQTQGCPSSWSSWLMNGVGIHTRLPPAVMSSEPGPESLFRRLLFVFRLLFAECDCEASLHQRYPQPLHFLTMPILPCRILVTMLCNRGCFWGITPFCCLQESVNKFMSLRQGEILLSVNSFRE